MHIGHSAHELTLSLATHLWLWSDHPECIIMASIKKLYYLECNQHQCFCWNTESELSLTFSRRAFCHSRNIIMYVRSLAPNEEKKCCEIKRVQLTVRWSLRALFQSKQSKCCIMEKHITTHKVKIYLRINEWRKSFIFKIWTLTCYILHTVDFQLLSCQTKRCLYM